MLKRFLLPLILALSLSSFVSPAHAWQWSDLFKDGNSSTTSNVKITKNDLLVGGGEYSANGKTDVTLEKNFLRGIQVYIIGLLGIVSVSVFLYIGYTLFTAQWKEEDFKKGWKALAYVVVGLAVIPLSYIVVKIVTGFTL